MRNYQLDNLNMNTVAELEVSVQEHGYTQTVKALEKMKENELAEFVYGMYRAVYYTEYSNYTLH